MTKKVIGITGGAGSGKTEVLRIMKEDYHAQIIIADDVARKLSSPGKKSYQRIVETFGKDILLADGNIDRPKLSGMYDILTQIVHTF